MRLLFALLLVGFVVSQQVIPAVEGEDPVQMVEEGAKHDGEHHEEHEGGHHEGHHGDHEGHHGEHHDDDHHGEHHEEHHGEQNGDDQHEEHHKHHGDHHDEERPEEEGHHKGHYDEDDDDEDDDDEGRDGKGYERHGGIPPHQLYLIVGVSVGIIAFFITLCCCCSSRGRVVTLDEEMAQFCEDEDEILDMVKEQSLREYEVSQGQGHNITTAPTSAPPVGVPTAEGYTRVAMSPEAYAASLSRA